MSPLNFHVKILCTSFIRKVNTIKCKSGKTGSKIKPLFIFKEHFTVTKTLCQKNLKTKLRRKMNKSLRK